MKIDDLGVQGKIQDILKQEGISELYPPQADAIEAGVLEGESLVLCTPTASGKTLVSELSALKALEGGGQVIYIVPLRALAAEKFKEFKKWEQLGYRVDIQMGDIDSKWLPEHGNFDILIATAEKCDSILRSRPGWFKDLKLLIMDEIHLITTDRGPTYEILIAKFKKLFPGVQVLGLSATIGNAGELADWLGAKLVKSDWRPVSLSQRLELKGTGNEGVFSEVKKSALDGAQSLVFVNSRRSAEAVASDLALKLEKELDETTKERLDTIADEITSALSSPTAQCRKLAASVKNGAAFHHAGLVNKQREIIENAFKEGHIKAISATPTLAAGVNLPARKVVIRDIKRYTGMGLDYIPVLEYYQMIGRAGRPKYDTMGESVLLAASDAEMEYLEDAYVNGQPEDIHSKLGVEPVLRMHILAAVASGFVRDKEALLDFFRKTFFAHEYGIDREFSRKIERILIQLEKWGFIAIKGGAVRKASDELFISASELADRGPGTEDSEARLIPTPLGSRVSELYIDPEDAHRFITTLEDPGNLGKIHPFSLLYLLTGSYELRPLLRVPQKQEDEIWGLYYEFEHKLMDEGHSGSESLERFKTAVMLNDWLEERTEDFILENHRMAPGLLRIKLDVAEWLTYSCAELAPYVKVGNPNDLKLAFQRLQIRLKHGVKEELLPLVSIKGIGRVRARKLFNAGIKTPNAVRNADMKKLGELLGDKIAKRVKLNLK